MEITTILRYIVNDKVYSMGNSTIISNMFNDVLLEKAIFHGNTTIISYISIDSLLA